jgi:RNA-binding protein
MPLTPQQRREMKALAHGLSPVVLIGGNGLTPAVLKEIDVALRAHELLKVQVAGEDKETRSLMMEQICAELRAEPVQSIGRMLVLFRENAEARAAVAAPRPVRRPPRTTKRSHQGSA